MSQLSSYMPEIIAFARGADAKAAYCFVLDGSKGTGGCPVILGIPDTGEEYFARCQELLEMLRRSAELLEADIKRHKAGVGVTP